MKILIIEDDFFIRDLYEKQLAKEGFKVFSSPDGPDGLVQASKLIPDLILLDIMLPKLNGIDLLRTLKSKKETRDIPVLMLTNLGQESVIKEAFKLGAAGYLMKTAYTPSQILKEIKSYLPPKTH